jgi:uncharacterized phage protein (TIGR01671 family)
MIPHEALLLVDGEFRAGIWNYEETEIVEDYDIVVMQFTGLTDKNGKEIYEGDIVKAESGWVKLGEIKYYKDGFDIVALDDPDYNGVSLRSVGQNFIEVIGNIFEHPHLLEKK